MNHIEAINAAAEAGLTHGEIARKIFLVYPTKVFIGNEEQQYAISNEIARHFDVPITSVQVAGSAKTGRSFFQQRDFIPGSSDLDIAIIDSRLFCKYMEIVFTETKGYTDKTGFSVRHKRPTFDEYMAYIAKGIFRPDLMPAGEEKAKINNFFGLLSRNHTSLFRDINAAIYLSESFFESKQRSAIKNHLISTKAL